MDEIGEVGNVENEVLFALYKDLTVNVADSEASIDVWVNNFFAADVKTGDVEGILKELGQRNFGGGGSLSWLSKNRQYYVRGYGIQVTKTRCTFYHSCKCPFVIREFFSIQKPI